MAEKVKGGNGVSGFDTIGSTKIHNRSRLSERLGKKTRRSLFLQSTVFDFLLVVALSVALAMTAAYGFNSASAYSGNPFVVFSLVTPVLLVLYVGTWSKEA